MLDGLLLPKQRVEASEKYIFQEFKMKMFGREVCPLVSPSRRGAVLLRALDCHLQSPAQQSLELAGSPSL